MKIVIECIIFLILNIFFWTINIKFIQTAVNYSRTENNRAYVAPVLYLYELC